MSALTTFLLSFVYATGVFVKRFLKDYLITHASSLGPLRSVRCHVLVKIYP